MAQQTIFDLEVREKKALASQLRGKTNGRRSRKNMLPVDYMTSKQRKEYTKGGEVFMGYLWDEILTIEKFNELPDDQKGQALDHWRKAFSGALIKKAYGWNDYTLYKNYDLYKVPYEKRTGKAKTAAPKKPAAQQKAAAKEQPATEQIAADLPAAQPVQILPAAQSGSTLLFDDLVTAEEAINKLMKYAAFLEGETNRFRLRLEITEEKGG